MSGKKTLLLFGLIGLVMVCSAGEPLVLHLDDAIDIALDRSYQIKYLKQSIRWAERNLWAARAGYRTQLSSHLYAPAYTEGFKLVEVLGETEVAKRFGSYQVRGTLDLTQPMPWIPLGGGSLTLRNEAYRLDSWTPSQDNPDVDIKTSKFYSSLSLRVEKPLFTINELKLGLLEAKLAYERRSKVYTRSELDLVYNVTNSFYRLYRNLQQFIIDQEKVKRQSEIYETTRNKFKAGLIAEVDAMQAEVELIQYQNDLKQSESALKEQDAAFKQLIGLELADSVSVITNIDIKPVFVDAEKAVALALKNRSEIVEREIDIEDQKISIKQIDARVSIKGSLSGYYDLEGFSDPNLPWGASTQDLFQSSYEQLKQTPNRGFTFELEVPLWDWGRNRAEVDAAKANLRQSELSLQDQKITIEREVRDLVRNVYQTFDRVQMLNKSRGVSEKSFEISLHRFDNGDITSTELARATEQLSSAKLSYLAAYVEYQLALADLKRKTLYDFENDRSLAGE